MAKQLSISPSPVQHLQNLPISLAVESQQVSDVLTPISNDACDVQIIQGIQLRLDHGATRSNSPVYGTTNDPFILTEQEEFLMQHYVKRLGRWVRLIRAEE